MIYKGLVVAGVLIKLEKYDGEKKMAECGIDNDHAQQKWGPQQPLRAEYEKWVSEGGIPQYEFYDEMPPEKDSEQTQQEIVLQAAKPRKKKEAENG